MTNYLEGGSRGGQAVVNVSKNLQNLLDEFSPDLKNARSIASQNFASKRAIDFGSSALNKDE